MDRGLKQLIYNLYGNFFIMKIINKHLFILLFLGLLPCGCDDGESPEEEHTDADGFILEDEVGSELYREFEGASTGSVTIGIGQTLELSVHFLDHDGNEIKHEDGEEEHEDELVITENETTIAIIEVEEHCDEMTDQITCESSDHCEWHTDEGACEDDGHNDHTHDEEDEDNHEMGIHIIGVSEGSTSFKLVLWHGDYPDGHADYTPTNKVPVNVTQKN